MGNDVNDADERSSMDVDLGGAWVWPRNQPNIISAFLHDPSVEIMTFLQPGEGFGSSETTRIVGGAVEFVNKIYDELQLETIEQNECELNKTEEQAIIQTECPVAAIRRNPNQTISVELENGKVIQTLYVVLAVPPRILSERVSFHPPLSREKSI